MATTTVEKTEESTTPKQISVSPAAFEVLASLYKLKADEQEVPAPSDVAPAIYAELIRKEVIERIGAQRGRGGQKGTVRILVPKEAITQSTRAPRGSGSTGRPPATRRLRESPNNVLSLSRASIPFDHTLVRRFLDATSPDAQRAFEQRQQSELSDTEVAKAIKGLKGQAVIDKMHEIMAAQNQTFEQSLRGRFPSEMIDVLGIPAVHSDTPDAQR